MWVFTKDGFLSIVQDRSHPGCLLVRARIKGDIERLFPTAPVERTENRDYLYRASIPAGEVAARIGWEVYNITYDNFKENITDKRRNLAYGHVWHIMANLQDELDG